MKNQALLSLKVKSKKNKMSSAAIFVWRFKGSACTCSVIQTYNAFLAELFKNCNVIHC